MSTESDYKIKGSSIRTKFQFVKERFGDAAENALQDKFDRSLLPLLDSSWYPFTFNEQVSQAIVHEHFGGDMSKLRDVGAFSAERVLTSVYKFYGTAKGFIEFLRRAELLHETCYSKGGMRVEIGGDLKSCQIHLRAPVFSEADMQVAAGFYTGAAGFFGEKNVSCACAPENSGAHFNMSWD